MPMIAMLLRDHSQVDEKDTPMCQAVGLGIFHFFGVHHLWTSRRCISGAIFGGLGNLKGSGIVEQPVEVLPSATFPVRYFLIS